VNIFVVTADDPSESVADILVIDDELHDVDPAAQSAVNQNDMYNVNRMLVLPDQVSFCSLECGCSPNS